MSRSAQQRDPWRFRCPNGHTDWRARSNGYRCKACGEEFAKLWDAKTGQKADV